MANSSHRWSPGGCFLRVAIHATHDTAWSCAVLTMPPYTLAFATAGPGPHLVLFSFDEWRKKLTELHPVTTDEIGFHGGARGGDQCSSQSELARDRRRGTLWQARPADAAGSLDGRAGWLAGRRTMEKWCPFLASKRVLCSRSPGATRSRQPGSARPSGSGTFSSLDGRGALADPTASQ